MESIGKLHYRNATDPTGFVRQHEPMHILNGIGQLSGSVRNPMPDKAGPSAFYRNGGPGTSGYNRYDAQIEAPVARLNNEFVRAAQEPTVIDKLTAAGLDVTTSPVPADLTKFLRDDMAKWPPIVKAAGATVD
ncbi:MAG TPA: hypothetical protein VNE58_12480 [Casimicrobiaceae bacterium]|nr:hypothetical protein [Casimicrobiaceae bacterium]